MILEDFHVHTTYCDGKNSTEEMVHAAIEKGMLRLGFSCHLYTDFDESYCIKKEKINEYKAEIANLKEKYKDKIEIFCGTEADYYSTESLDGFDYVIGSVHYVKKDGKFFALDISEEEFIDFVETCYGGDYFAICEDYYKNVADLIDKINPDIIGHFDLITKFNENNKLFDTSNPRYVTAAKNAIDALLKRNIPFEINTGAIYRGYRSKAYPEYQFLKYILENGGRIVLSSDSHSVNSLCYSFEQYEKIVNNMGFEVNKIKL